MKTYFSKKNIGIFNRVLGYEFKSAIRSERTWVVNLIVFPFITFSVFFIYSFYYSKFTLLPPQILSIFLLSPILSSLYFSFVFIERKNTVILSQLKFSGVKNYFILFSLSIVSILFSILSLIISICIIRTFSFIYSNLDYSFGFNNSYLYNLDWYIWFYFIIAYIMIGFLSLLILIFFTNLINSKNISLILILFITIIFILFSDIVVNSYISTRNNFMSYFGYLIPTKYIVWFVMLTSSYTFIDHEGIQQIISDNIHQETHVFIYSSVLCISLSFILIGTFFYLACVNFKWMERG